MNRSIGRGVERRRHGETEVVYMAEQRHQLVVQVGVAGGDNIHDDQPNTPLEVGGTLGGKGSTCFLAVLVSWADEFDGRDQGRAGHAAEDLRLEVVGKQGGADGYRRGRGPGARLHGRGGTVGTRFL